MKKINVPKPKILTGAEMLSEADRMSRAEIEAKRGIVRDEKGGIIMTPGQIKGRIAQLEAKKETVKARMRDAKNIIAANTKKLTKAIEDDNGENALDLDKNIDKQKAKVEILNQRLKDIDAKIKELN